MSRRLKIGILGISGKMGKKLHALVMDHADYQDSYHLVFAASGPNDPRFGLLASTDMDVLVDFSAVASTLAAAKICARNKTPLLICTTGFSEAQVKGLEKTMKGVPWALIPNTSLGVYALKKIVETLARILPPDYQFEIVEMHHSEKKDAPSGTAKFLAQKIAAARRLLSVPSHSLRGGTEVGEHQIIVMGPDERIELTHKAHDRQLFAHGALKLAKELATKRAKKTGAPYTAEDLFEK